MPTDAAMTSWWPLIHIEFIAFFDIFHGLPPDLHRKRLTLRRALELPLRNQRLGPSQRAPYWLPEEMISLTH
jgi:hypothetical protein